MERTNADMANDAREILDYYDAKHQTSDDAETVLVDLLADLMHMCNRDGIDFDRKLGTARMHFEEEAGA